MGHVVVIELAQKTGLGESLRNSGQRKEDGFRNSVTFYEDYLFHVLIILSFIFSCILYRRRCKHGNNEKN
jgi:hypothetical protein